MVLPLGGILFIASCVQGRPPAPSSSANGESGAQSSDIERAAQFFNKLGLAAMAEENYAKAIANFKKAVMVNPYDPELWKNLGEAYTAAKFYQKAEKAFRRALALKPDYGEVYYDLGILYTAWGKYKKAEQWLKKAAALDTYEERYKAYYALAQLYKQLGREREYAEALQRAVDLYPKYREALLELARYWWKRKNYTKAQIYYIQYLQAYPNDEKIALEFAQLLIEAKKYTAAKKLLKELISNSQNPQTVQAAYRLVNRLLVAEAKERLKQKGKGMNP